MTNWGIVSTGFIANEFARDLKFAKDANIKAVSSRNQQTADEFAKKHGVELSFSSYEQMADCDEVDAVYIGTPHIFHLENVKMFLERKKPVLCEKPLGVNAGETIEMIETAKKNNAFLLEGMWTRFFPYTRQAIEWVKNGEIGEVQFFNMTFGYNGDGNGWRWDNNMAGGSVLDLGVYNIAAAFAFLGADYRDIIGAAKVENGADVLSTAVLVYENGAIANLSFSMNQIMNNIIEIQGTKGGVNLGIGSWDKNRTATLQKTTKIGFTHDEEKKVFEIPYEGTGFQFEAMHVADCLNKGLTESPLMTHEDSINIAKTMDKLREIYGVQYEQDLAD